MFALHTFLAVGPHAEAKNYWLKQHLQRLSRTGYGETTKITYTAQVVPYPNPTAFESHHEDGGVLTTKRFYLTEGRAIILHWEQRAKLTGELIDSHLTFVRQIPESEFQLMLPAGLEPYFA